MNIYRTVKEVTINATRNGTTVTINPIISKENITNSTNNSNQITIDNLPFTLIKNLTIPNELDTLEDYDVIKGFIPNGDYIEALYKGGDATDFLNETVYTIFTGS